MAPSHSEQLFPGARIGHYCVDSLISSGGFGAVYRVTRDGRPFALKVPLTRSSSDEARKVTEARIVREVVSLMSLQHPGIVGVHGFDRWPDPVTGALYLVMDFVDGRPLKRWREAASPSLREILDVFRQLALAVEAMHAMGVVHRDIKSSNVLVSLCRGSLEAAPRSASAADATSFDRASHSPGAASRSADATGATSFDRAAHSTGAATRSASTTDAASFGRASHSPVTLVNRTGSPVYRPVLVDFGLARPTFTTDVTAEHVVVGTEGALAPELLASSGKHFHYTPATDLYALGRLFFEVLTGLADPYRPATLSGARHLFLPSAVAPGLTPLVDPLLTDLLDSDPARRTPSAAELARQLEALLADESWGDTLPVRASFLCGNGLDLDGRFITRAERNATPTSAQPLVISETAEFDGAPTLPMFVLDSNETLAGKYEPPAPTPEPSSTPAEPTASPREAGVRHTSHWRRMGRFVGMLMVGWMAWFTVLALLSWALSPADDSSTVGAADWTAPSRPATHPSSTPAAKAAQPQSRAVFPSMSRVAMVRSAPAPQLSVMARAALVGHAAPGPVRAVLRQPVQLAALALPTGTTLEGTANALPDGQFLLRFDSAPQANGSARALTATALVDARAALRRPLTKSPPSAAYEFDLSFVPSEVNR